MRGRRVDSPFFASSCLCGDSAQLLPRRREDTKSQACARHCAGLAGGI